MFMSLTPYHGENNERLGIPLVTTTPVVIAMSWRCKAMHKTFRTTKQPRLSSVILPRLHYDGYITDGKCRDFVKKRDFRSPRKRAVQIKCGRLDVCKSGVCGAGLNRNME